LSCNTTVGANGSARATQGAQIIKNHYLAFFFLALRVGTPFTPKGAAFKINKCSNTGTVIHGIALDVENSAGPIF
jgi:hypothetical protein